MNITGIIAEYNPFHNGHQYHIDQARTRTKADGIIVVMGGNFLQRGEPSIVDKYQRTYAALAAGADLVLELPLAAACGSAPDFAAGAAALLGACGCVSHLAFGCETDDLLLLCKTADLLSGQDLTAETAISSYLKKGFSYPAACAEALKDIFPEGNRLLEHPNNVLAVEYIKAIRRQNLPFTPIPILRRGSYHDLSLSASYASASALRAALQNQLPAEQWTHLLPETMKDRLTYQITAEDFSSVLAYKLRSLSREELASFKDVSPEMASRIYSQFPYYMSFSELCSKIASRSFTLARIKRALLHILLDIKSEESPLPTFIKILGLNPASPVPRLLRQNAQLPVITKPADAPAKLTESLTAAADLYNQTAFFSKQILLPDEYHAGPIIYKKP